MAQQVGRSAVAASRYVGAKIEWARLLKLSGANTTTVSNLQAKWSQAATKMNALTDALPKIDFEYYRKMVSDPSLVDKLQKEYENAHIAYPIDTANRFKELDEYAKTEEKRAQEFVKLAEGEVEVLRKEFNRWDNVPPADEITYELASFYMPEAVYPRVWNKDEFDKLKDVQFLPYEKRDSLRWWVEQGGELLPHKHEWVAPEEATDPIDAAPRPKKEIAEHGHGDAKKLSAKH
ncbi:unnamed protein product [Rotaria socialis]|uniref:ATP synthase subunit d, mitochondrial n=1 Tax=Rotaria socialis TaxID=392032 RepID=A0A818LKY3_9BILA|nr:unnamed protein product [Rotaria socialis]CAF3377913.1 unnamed protein product [Rotaria socialis]CAF3378417.1 unnamed protein product [Rotaria socialis]CAF3568425.1 unnamed protein product [Rotaria socialis]CAF3574580.1 unnamed protein product [Rotaria socialis]